MSEVVRARNIQKAYVDQKKTSEELLEEEVAKFHKLAVKEVKKIVPTIESAIESSNMKMIKDSTSAIPQLLSIQPPINILTIDPDKELDIQLILPINY